MSKDATIIYRVLFDAYSPWKKEMSYKGDCIQRGNESHKSSHVEIPYSHGSSSLLLHCVYSEPALGNN
jgi:hypothetical protein